jgi:hypothetical protein
MREGPDLGHQVNIVAGERRAALMEKRRERMPRMSSDERMAKRDPRSKMTVFL